MKVTFETKLTMKELVTSTLSKNMCPKDLGISGGACDVEEDIENPVLCSDCWKMVLQEVEDGKENSNQ